MTNLWLNCRGLPPHVAAVLAALHLRDPRIGPLASLEGRDLAQALEYADKSGLTLLLRPFLREETAGRAARNVRRVEAARETYRRMTGLPGEFVALKGLTQCELFGIRPEDRPQYDIDLYFPRETVEAARDALLAQEYESIPGLESFPTDHLPGLFPRTAWRWRGDYFDPEMPLAIELHFQFWNANLERLSAPGIELFWERRVRRVIGGVELTVLCPQDTAAYAALHLFKHLVHGDTKAFHVYELASFLELHAHDDAFWANWRAMHSPELRRLQTVAFLLAEAWFGCELGSTVEEEARDLPPAALDWFPVFAASPAVQPFQPNKDELWLHLSLLHSTADKLRVARRRLFPANLPPPARATESESPRQVYASWFASRLRHHAMSLGATVTGGVQWWWRSSGFTEEFWSFLAAAVLFNLALFIFFLLYNIFLAGLGLDMRVIGSVNGAARFGSLAGTLPAAWIAHRFGLRNTLLGAIGTTAALIALRAVIFDPYGVIGLAFAGGVVFAVWAVIMAPWISAVVEERRRPAAFSFFFAVMFATGIAGNSIGGILPDLAGGVQNALLIASGIAFAALFPAMQLRQVAAAAPAAGTRIYPRGAFLLRFLIPFAIWHLATGIFNPFTNLYFTHLKFATASIGGIFSAGQFVQVIAVLFAPLVIRRFGLVSGISFMMGATALALAALAAQSPGAAAIAAYGAYMAFQWMSEPGLNTLLMNRVGERERAGASSLNYLVAFGAQALAAFAAGVAVDQFGYGPVLATAASLAIVAAFSFRWLLR